MKFEDPEKSIQLHGPIGLSEHWVGNLPQISLPWWPKIYPLRPDLCKNIWKFRRRTWEIITEVMRRLVVPADTEVLCSLQDFHYLPIFFEHFLEKEIYHALRLGQRELPSEGVCSVPSLTKLFGEMSKFPWRTAAYSILLLQCRLSWRELWKSRLCSACILIAFSTLCYE